MSIYMRFGLLTLLAAATLILPARLLALRDENTITVVGSSTMVPVMDSLTPEFGRDVSDMTVLVLPTGTSKGIRMLINGEHDLAMALWVLTKSEIELAEEKGIKLVSTQLASDCLIMTVHPSNPIKDLSLADLKGLYCGGVTNWSQIGGPDVPSICFIRPYPRAWKCGFFQRGGLGRCQLRPQLQGGSTNSK